MEKASKTFQKSNHSPLPGNMYETVNIDVQSIILCIRSRRRNWENDRTIKEKRMKKVREN